jgi:putative ABC transport system substrate-binding protein
MIRRREFIALIGGAAAAWPLAARAQQRPIRFIGVLHITSPGEALMSGFYQGLGEAGYTEGRNVAMIFRLAEGRVDRLPALAQDLVQRDVDMIFAIGGSISARAAKAATTTIPILFMVGDVDPVQAGLVTSLGRPGGNVTGISLLAGALGSKRVEILREVVSEAMVIGVLINPANPYSQPHAKEVEDAVRAAGRRAVILRAASASEFDQVSDAINQQNVNALIVTADNIFQRAGPQLVALAARHRIPTIYQWRDFVAVGGLASYGASLKDTARQAGNYAGRILKGTNPSDLPILQPTKFELIINLKTAKALGLTVPPSLLARADEVIE